jgi:hypothetical protein
MVRYSVSCLPLGSSGLCILQRFVVGVHASSAGGREAPVRTEPLPTALRRAVACSGQAQSVALCLEQILLVLVVVLVLDTFWGVPSGALSGLFAEYDETPDLRALFMGKSRCCAYSERMAAVAGVPPSIRATRFRAVV